MNQSNDISARVERLLTAQPAAPPEVRRVRRRFPIDRRWDESDRYVGFCVRVDDEFAEAYRRPAQYVTLKVSGCPARFYVVASRPRRNIWEFLVDRQGEIGPELAALEVGDDVIVSLPEGEGFDPTEAAGRTAVLFCTGSGIATMRPLIERWLADGTPTPASVAVYYGERRDGDFAYVDLARQWQSEGVAIHRAVEHQRDTEVAHRYVQHAFEANPVGIDDAFAYLSGAPVMIQVVAEKLLDDGIASSRMKVNI